VKVRARLLQPHRAAGILGHEVRSVLPADVSPFSRWRLDNDRHCPARRFGS
jgi:hypothetical protein